MKIAALACLLLSTSVSSTAAGGATRNFGASDFDRIRISGDFVVEIKQSRITSVTVNGPTAAVDATLADVEGRTLTLHRNQANWMGNGASDAAPTVTITTPVLSDLRVTGSASVHAAQMRGMAMVVSLNGAGRLTVDAATGERLTVAQLGAGKLVVAGRVAMLGAVLRGSGDFDAARLNAENVKLTAETSGNATLAASRTAAITASGSGVVTVIGKPACTVKNVGSGSISCGSQQP